MEKPRDGLPENLARMGRQGGRDRFRPHEKAKDARGTLLRLLKLYMKEGRALLGAALMTICSAGAALAAPYLIGSAINTMDIASGTVDRPVLTTVLLALISCYAAGWLLDTGSGVIMARVSQNLVRSLRRQFFRKLQSLPLPFYDTHPHGDTMSRLTNDVDNISSTIAQSTTQLVSNLLSVTGAFVMMLLLSPPLTVVAALTIPLVFALTKAIAGRSRRYFLEQQRALGALGGLTEEAIVGLKMVKAFGREEATMASFEEENARLREVSTKAQTWSGFLMPMMNVINNLSFAFVACAGGLMSVKGMVSVGVVVSFITYSRQFGQPLNNIAGMFNTLQSALAGAERVFEILDEAEEPADAPGAAELIDPKGRVEFREVSFSYTPGSPVLQKVSFTVEPGEVVALVGETGAGKTTIVNLLTRFYEPDSGAILIDGKNIAAVKRRSLLDSFSVVLQDTCLFTGSIGDNIRYSSPDASEEEVAEAARLAGADGFISRLPDGYRTMVSGSTSSLSQGQRQLLAIARAFLRRAPILILDEATSSVDTRTEKKIQRAMVRLMEGHTCFLIAHRLSTIRDADRIMVVAGGTIAESGTHDELMARRGRYYRMVVSQTGQDERTGALGPRPLESNEIPGYGVS